MTQDVRTMPQHWASFLQQGNHGPGVVLIPQSVPAAAAIYAPILIWLIWAATEPAEWADRIISIPL